MRKFRALLLAVVFSCVGSGASHAQAERTLESTQRFLSNHLLGQTVMPLGPITEARFMSSYPARETQALTMPAECALGLRTSQGVVVLIDFTRADWRNGINSIGFDTGVSRSDYRSPPGTASLEILFVSERLRDRALPALQFMGQYCYERSDTGY